MNRSKKIISLIIVMSFAAGVVFIPSEKNSALGVGEGSVSIGEAGEFITGGGLGNSIPGLDSIPGVGGAGMFVPTFDVALNPIFVPAQLGFKAAEKLKDWSLDAIAWQAAKFVIRQIVDDLADWLRGGAEGKPHFIQDFGDYLKEAGDIAGGMLLEQIFKEDAKLLCEPWRAQIVLDIFKPRTFRDSFEFNAECRISDVLKAAGQAGVDITINDFYDDFNKGGWGAFLTMSLDDASNPIGSYLMTLEEKDKRIEFAKEKSKLEATVNKGLKLGVDCLIKDLQGNCVKSDILTPGVVLEGALQDVFGSEIKQLELADELNELISAAIAGIKMKRLWQKGIADSSSGSSGWLYDKDLTGGSDSGEIWGPPDQTKITMMFVLGDYISKEREYLKIKKVSKKILEENILPAAPAEQKAYFENLLQKIQNNIINAEKITYEEGADPVAGLLINKYPKWFENTNEGKAQKNAFCAEATAIPNPPGLQNLQIKVVCTDDPIRLRELDDFINIYVPSMLGQPAEALNEYNNLASQANIGFIIPLSEQTELIEPADDATITGPVKFDWKDMSGATGYRLKVFYPDGSTVTADYTNSEITQTQADFDALEEGEYFWQIAAIDSEGNLGQYSEIRKIIIQKPQD